MDSYSILYILEMQGLVTTGWNFSTTPGCSTLQNHTEISHITSTDQHKYKIKDYCSPVESAATNAATRRAAKQLPALQIQMWQHKYGKEGAAAMQQMQSQKPADPRKTFKVICTLLCTIQFQCMVCRFAISYVCSREYM